MYLYVFCTVKLRYKMVTRGTRLDGLYKVMRRGAVQATRPFTPWNTIMCNIMLALYKLEVTILKLVFYHMGKNSHHDSMFYKGQM